MTLNIGGMTQLVTLANPGAAIPDGDGGFTQTWSPLSPSEWWAAMEKASQRAIERNFAGTVLAQATHLFKGRYHPEISTQTRLTWTDRSGREHTANVLDLDDVGGAGAETVVLASEVVQ